MSFFVRAKGAVSTSTMKKSATDSIGSRALCFPAVDRFGTLIGGDQTVNSVAISATTMALLKDVPQQLTASPRNAAGDTLTDAVTWASDTPGVATVSSTGLVTAVAVGTCNITATSATVDSTACAVTVTAVLTGLTLADATLSFAHTTTGTTTVSAQDQFGANMALPGGVAVASSNEAVATVGLASTTLTVTGVAAGTTNVTASKSGITSNTCVVTCS